VSNIDTPGDDIGFAYYATLERDDTDGSGQVVLYRKRTGGGGGDLVKTMAAASTTLNEDTAYRIRVQIANQLSTGDPQIKVYLDGTQVVLIKDSGFSALDVGTDGTVVDPTSNKIPSGPGEALYLSIPDTVGHTIAVTDWKEESASTSDDLPEQNQASISVLSETAAATGTLTVPIDWDIELVRGQEARAMQFEGGYVYTNVARSLQRRRWSVRQAAALESEVTELRAFWDSHRGSEIPFSWTPPNASATVYVHFVGDTLTDREKAPGVYDFGFDLEELTDGA
jgi:phage-related protein